MTDTQQPASDTLSTKAVADLIGRTTPSVRQYTQHFAEFLSATATPAKGGRRTFQRSDAQVLYAASRLLDAGLTYSEVRQRLAEGAAQLDEFQLPPESEPEPDPEPAGASMISVAEFRALIAPLEQAAAEWRELAESRRLENAELREELRQRRPWWRRLFGG